MSSAVLDASALIAWLRREPGADRLKGRIAGALVSSVNIAEVHSKLVADGTDEDDAWKQIQYLGCESVVFGDALARAAGGMARRTKPYGLSLGDRACLALAIQRNATVYTADRAWSGLSLGIKIEVLR